MSETRESLGKKLFNQAQENAAALFPNEEYNKAIWSWVPEFTREGYRVRADKILEEEA